MALTPLEKFKKANDELHETFNGVLMEESIDVSSKTEAANHMKIIFDHLELIEKILTPEE